ncbi:MAG: MBL fold metallo-hydrolase [Acidimicrobiales bacterium]|nr:MBL fold metallo-hydrolase [Acidimicrobiales bacterium]
MENNYTRGLHELGDGLFTWLLPNGSWGWSNAGLVAGDERSLLVDTLFDLKLTQEMLDGLKAVTSTRPISTLVNTHANGDHCWGNELVTGAEIIATDACAAEFDEMPPSMTQQLLSTAWGDPVVEEYMAVFAAFRFDDITLTPPSRTFSSELTITLDDRQIHLLEVGPAHTQGDLIVHVPDASTVFTGDIVFVNGTPLWWAGPLDGYIRACDVILALGADTVVPGHGPVTDNDGVRRVKAYLEFVRAEGTLRHAAGMSAVDAARDIDLGEFGECTDAERIVTNLHSLYGELDPDYVSPSLEDSMREMAHLAKHFASA